MCSAATALYWERNYLKRASSFVTLVDCCCAYVDCVIALVHLFFKCSNRLCFLMQPLMPHALTLQSLIACFLPRHPQHKRCFLTAPYRSFTLMFLNSGQFPILWVPSASGQWLFCVCFVSFTFELALKFDVFENRLSLFGLLRSSPLCSPLKILHVRMLS